MTIKSFRGRMADGDQITIRLSTNDGKTGYMIKKFQIMPTEPGENQVESTFKIYSVPPDAIDNSVNFDDPLLLGVGYLQSYAGTAYAGWDTVIFDHVKINQDIFITHVDSNGTEPCNFYLELEQVKLSVDEAAVATLKDMRGTN